MEYAVYKGDDLLAIGTDKECAQELGVTPKYIRWMTTPAAKKRIQSKADPEAATTAVKIEEGD